MHSETRRVLDATTAETLGTASSSTRSTVNSSLAAVRAAAETSRDRRTHPQDIASPDGCPPRCATTTKLQVRYQPGHTADTRPELLHCSRCGRQERGESGTIFRRRRGPASRGEYGVSNGRRPDSRAGEATGASARLRRCGHRTRRDPRRGCRLCDGHGMDNRPRRTPRDDRCCGFTARTTRIAAHQRRHRATQDSASISTAVRSCAQPDTVVPRSSSGSCTSTSSPSAVRQQSVSRPSSGCWSVRWSAASEESGPYARPRRWAYSAGSAPITLAAQARFLVTSLRPCCEEAVQKGVREWSRRPAGP